MISQHFEYHCPLTPEAAALLLQRFGDDAMVLGGGTMLVPSMSANLAHPGHLISLSALGLDEIVLEDLHLRIGAMTTYAQLLASPLVATHAPLLAAMAMQVTGGASILNQGTLGGAASFANPSSDAPGCLVAVEATVELRSTRGVRHVAAREFFVDAFCTARNKNEFLAGICVPRDPTLVACQYQKYKSSASSWPIVTVACSLHRDEQTSVRLAVGAAGRRPAFRRFVIDEQTLRAPDAFVEKAAMTALDLVGEGWSDELADADYRRAIVPGVVRRHVRSVLTGEKP
jgi:aerobic carbon-monoxide dehydrogenase medium subunit